MLSIFKNKQPGFQTEHDFKHVFDFFFRIHSNIATFARQTTIKNNDNED